MFRYKPGLNISYERQGYIYFASLLYSKLPESSQEKIRSACRRAGGEYWKAVLEFVTTHAGAETVCARHYISRATLLRVVRQYYKEFPVHL